MFTPLGASGREGPSDTSGYKHTALEGSVQLSDGVQRWSAPVSGLYGIEARGAQGGNGLGVVGGEGAVVSGTLYLRRGTLLFILVGQQGQTEGGTAAGSGGGGTFVLVGNDTALVVAGGGGGGGRNTGAPGQRTNNGSVNGGVKGSGGSTCIASSYSGGCKAGAGAGVYGNGTCAEPGKGVLFCPQAKHCKQGGKAITSGGRGGESVTATICDGGFGGGGACHEMDPGAGGGFSGGGVHCAGNRCTAGGGGSFVPVGEKWDVSAGGNRGHGSVVITFVP